MFCKRNLTIAAALLLGIGLGWSTAALKAENEKRSMVYELRTYVTHDGRLPALNARFEHHTMKLFEKHGMKNVIYATQIDNEGKPVENKLVYLLAHQSQAAAAASFSEFRKDPEWIAARDESEKDGKIVSKVETMFLVPTAYSPLK